MTDMAFHKEPKNVLRVSWWAVIIELGRHGYTSIQIAAAIGCGGSTVRDWKNLDAEPGHVDGERLIALWRVVTGLPRDQVPMRDGHTLSAADFK